MESETIRQSQRDPLCPGSNGGCDPSPGCFLLCPQEDPWEEHRRLPELLIQIPGSAKATDWADTELLFISLVGPNVGFY